MIRFIRTFRDKRKKGNDGRAKLHLPTTTAKFDAVREAELVKLGFAVKVEKKAVKEDKSDEPKNVEKK